MTFAALFAIWVLHLFAAVSPGPAVVMAARTGILEGMRTGAWLAAGIGVGGVIWAAAALFGLALVFEAAPMLLISLKVLGGVYLIWMGWKLWAHASLPVDTKSADALPQSALSAFRLGVVTQLINPKPAILFSAIFIGTVPPGAGWPVFAIILILVFLNETLWNIAVVRIFSLDRTRNAYVGLKTSLDRLFGGLLALLGLKLAAT